MNQSMLDALNRIASRLIAMPQSEFDAKLESHSDGEISQAIKEKIEFFSQLQFMVFSELILKNHKPHFSVGQIEYDNSICNAANDETFMMAA